MHHSAPQVGMWILMLPIFLASIAGTVFWIWMLVECLTKERSEGNDKVVWIIVIVFTQAIGALIYFFVRRPKRIKEQLRDFRRIHVVLGAPLIASIRICSLDLDIVGHQDGLDEFRNQDALCGIV